MPLPSSGPLSLNDIQTEFGGTNPISLSEYYAGGANVPAGTTGTYGVVPSSGTISIRNFYGTSKVVISIFNDSVNFSSGGLTSATAGYRLTSGGQIEHNQQNIYSNVGEWITPTSQASNYEVFAALDFGTLSSGTTGSWLALSSNQEWTCFAAPNNLEQAIITLQIRRIGTTTILGSAQITITADAFL